MLFATAITADYLHRAAPLLASLHRLRSCRSWVVTVGFQMPRGCGYRTQALPDTGLRCNQAGQLLDVLEVEDDEVLIQGDADAVIQRDLTIEEWADLARLDERTIALGRNRLGPESGAEEYQALRPLRSLRDVNERLGVELDDVAVYNAGFAAARPAVWRELRKMFDVLYAAGNHLFQNWRCCQLLLCCAIWHLGLEVLELPRTLHAHQHFGPAPGDLVEGGRLYVAGGELPLFAHHVPELGLLGA